MISDKLLIYFRGIRIPHCFASQMNASHIRIHNQRPKNQWRKNQSSNYTNLLPTEICIPVVEIFYISLLIILFMMPTLVVNSDIKLI